MNEKKLKITSCISCPNRYLSRNGDGKDKTKCYEAKQEITFTDTDGDSAIPSWCPLPNYND